MVSPFISAVFAFSPSRVDCSFSISRVVASHVAFPAPFGSLMTVRYSLSFSMARWMSRSLACAKPPLCDFHSVDAPICCRATVSYSRIRSSTFPMATL